MDEWLCCAGEWQRSNLYKRMKLSKTTSQHGARLWMTFQQIADKYKSVEIARAIVRAKTEDPEVAKTHCKPHPDCPDNKAG